MIIIHHGNENDHDSYLLPNIFDSYKISLSTKTHFHAIKVFHIHFKCVGEFLGDFVSLHAVVYYVFRPFTYINDCRGHI